MIRMVLFLLFCSTFVVADCMMHDQHQAGLQERGDHAMGFDHAKTTHHFLLSQDGGAIQVTANDPKDTASADQIRMHLKHIATMFSEGNFEIPMFIHDTVPAGVPAMKQLKKEITYRYETLDSGGKIVISSANAEALSAIHDFLRFQIDDHKTGDPKETP